MRFKTQILNEKTLNKKSYFIDINKKTLYKNNVFI